MILVTGATGHVGGRAAELLSAAGQELRLMARDPERAPAITNAEVVKGDYADPASLDSAFGGVDAAFVVSVYGRPGDRARLHAAAFEAAARAGTRHVVYLSVQRADPRSRFPYSRDHHASEASLRASGVPFTILRDNLYQELVPTLVDAEGRLRGPGGAGRFAAVSRDDVARAVAAALVREPRGETFEISGPEALGFAELAAHLTAATGRPIRYEDESEEAGRAWRAKLGAPEWELEVWLGTYLAIGAGELERTGDGVLALTGRPPRSFDETLRANPELLERLRLPPERAPV